MVRFKWRAPYFMSVPSCNKYSFAVSVTENTNGVELELKIRCCRMFSSSPSIFRSSRSPSSLNTTTLSMRFMNSGVNLRRAASTPARAILSVARSSSFPFWCCLSISDAANPKLGLKMELISPAPRLLVMKIMVREKSTRRLSPSVKLALSRMPRSRFQRASLAFSISSKSTKLSLIFSVWYWLSASWLSSGCVSRWPRYPGGEPISLAISWLCWNSAQSILIMARRSPIRLSAVASTIRVLPVPVGPRNRKLPIGRPGLFIPARYI